MEGASGRIGWPHRWHLARETRRLSWALKIYSTSPSVRGESHWVSPRPQRWRWLEARRKTANSVPPRLIERTNEHLCEARTLPTNAGSPESCS